MICLTHQTKPMTSPTTPAQDHSSNTTGGPRILIADDSALIRRTYQFVLELLGYRVTTVIDGKDALARLSTENFDLLITDYDMPRMDGASLIREIRHWGNRLPIILISGSIMSSDELPFDIRDQISLSLSKTADSASLLAQVTRLVPPAVQSGWTREES